MFTLLFPIFSLVILCVIMDFDRRICLEIGCPVFGFIYLHWPLMFYFHLTDADEYYCCHSTNWTDVREDLHSLITIVWLRLRAVQWNSLGTKYIFEF